MGRRGPPPEPYEKAAAKGSWRAEQRRPAVSVTEGVGAPPDYLGEQGRAEWLSMVRRCNWIKATDRATLEAYCKHYDLWREAIEVLRRLTPGTMDHRRQVRTVHDLATAWQRSAWRLGLSPSDRSSVDAGSEPTGDEIDQLLRGAG